VTTPSWPAAGNRNNPRRNDGNTLGCVIDNNVKVSQHAFALKLSQNDVVSVLNGLKNASIVTDPTNRQIVRNGGPSAIMALVSGLGSRVKTSQATVATLSTGVRLISKPSRLHVPPWQMVSALLGGVSLRTATWWAKPQIFSTITSTKIACWDDSLGSPGAVRIALTGQWEGQSIGLRGGLGTDRNHAKIGVSTSGGQRLAIFGDLNQQGLISGSNCASSQNGRGGLFYVVQNAEIADSIAALIDGDTAPTRARQSNAVRRLEPFEEPWSRASSALRPGRAGRRTGSLTGPRLVRGEPVERRHRVSGRRGCGRHRPVSGA
jgi:hypothetical protein